MIEHYVDLHQVQSFLYLSNYPIVMCHDTVTRFLCGSWASYYSKYMLSRKRTCRLNLGGHCATEDAASMVNQWHFLNSPLSPGRRRRRNAVQPAGVHDAANSVSDRWVHLALGTVGSRGGARLGRPRSLRRKNHPLSTFFASVFFSSSPSLCGPFSHNPRSAIGTWTWVEANGSMALAFYVRRWTRRSVAETPQHLSHSRAELKFQYNSLSQVRCDFGGLLYDVWARA